MIIFVVIATIFSLYIRYKFYSFETGDFKWYLDPCIKEISKRVIAFPPAP